MKRKRQLFRDRVSMSVDRLAASYIIHNYISSQIGGPPYQSLRFESHASIKQEHGGSKGSSMPCTNPEMRRHYIPLSLSYVFKIKQAGEQLLCVNFQDKRLNGKPTTCLVRQYVRGTHMLFYIIGFEITSQTTQLAVVQVHNVLINGRNGSVCNDASYSTLQVKKRASDKTSKGRQVHTVLYVASSWMSAQRTDRSLDLQLCEFQSHVKLKLASSPLFSVPCTWLVYQSETNNTAGLMALRFFIAFSQPIHTYSSQFSLFNT